MSFDDDLKHSNDWKKVSEVCSIHLGGTPKTNVKEFWDGDVKWASAKDVASSQGRFITDTEKKITEKGVNGSNAKVFPYGTIVITARGTVGKLAILGEPMAFNQTCYGLIPKSESDNIYVFYALRNAISEIMNLSYGTVFQTITMKTFDELEIGVPPLQQQKKVSKILSDLDSKIELNQQMNKTLESIAQAIFKHWFIDFEFPDENGKPYKSSGEMVASELGEIPKGWNVIPFSHVIAVNPNRRLPKGKLSKKIAMSDLNPWQSWIQNWSYEPFHSGSKFQNGDTLFARITPSLEHGKTALVNVLGKDEVGFGSTEFIVLGAKEIKSMFYIFNLSRSEYVRTTAIGAMSGTSGRQRVPYELFDHLLIVSPPKALIDFFDKLVAPFFTKIFQNVEESMVLTQIRDLLLPKLMSGKIRVSLEE